MKWLQFALCFFLMVCTTSCSTEKGLSRRNNAIRVATEKDPQTLDPRQARDLSTVTTLHMLYEGMMQFASDGAVIPALASSVEISSDEKLYTFTLKEAYWSNGDPITAQDFEQTWKTMLAPTYPAPNAYQLYVIRGAKDYKEGSGTAENVGIFTQGPKTLIVQLDRNTPHFLELLTAHFTFPLNKNWIKKVEDNPEINWAEAPYSGPFQYEEWVHHSHFTAKKNAYYWNHENVKLNAVSLIVVEDSTALHLFQHNELDWVGSPLSTLPTDAMLSLKGNSELIVSPAAGTFWFRVNVAKPVINNQAFRSALSLGINRKELVDLVLMGAQKPALTVVPPLMGLQTISPLSVTEDSNKAHQQLDLAMKQLGITPDDIPPLKICYPQDDRKRKVAQAIQQQWIHTLNIPIELEACEGKLFNEKVAKGDYQIALGSWFADIHDPMNFLEIFESEERSTNQTGWSSKTYKELVERAAHERNPADRKHLLERGEGMLLESMPVIPLFHYSFLALKKPGLEGVFVNPLGYMDFKAAYWKTLEK